MNLTAMVKNGRQNLPVEFVASAGLEYQRSSYGNVLGARLGMQMRFIILHRQCIYMQNRVSVCMPAAA